MGVPGAGGVRRREVLAKKFDETDSKRVNALSQNGLGKSYSFMAQKKHERCVGGKNGGVTRTGTHGKGMRSKRRGIVGVNP